MRILIGGGSGFIGSALTKSLQKSGDYHVSIISRTAGENRYTWNAIREKGLPQCDAIVQIPGANFFEKSWTPARKKELYDSRVGLTKILVDEINKKASGERPKVFISASAIGYYPISPRGQTFDDYYTGPPADNYGGEVCAKWEQTVNELPSDVRKVILRFGIVLDKGGGALSQMLLPFKLGVGGPFGDGQQYWPWIHRKDLVNVIQRALEDTKISGTVNVVAPECVTNEQFSSTIGEVLHRPTIIRTPLFALKLAFGERHFMLSEGNKVVPKRLQEWNFPFMYPTLKSALTNILKE